MSVFRQGLIKVCGLNLEASDLAKRVFLVLSGMMPITINKYYLHYIRVRIYFQAVFEISNFYFHFFF